MTHQEEEVDQRKEQKDQKDLPKKTKFDNLGTSKPISPVNEILSDKIFVAQSDILNVKCDVVVNDAKESSSTNSDIVLVSENVPVPLINDANVCFFNSVVQVFYSLSPFHRHI